MLQRLKAWRVTETFVASVTSAALSMAPAAGHAGQRAVLDFQGLAWETGSFPPSAPGDELRIVCVVNELSDILGIDLQTTEVTAVLSGMVSNGSTDLGGGVTLTTYSGGTVRFYEDANRDHDFAPDPPNAQVPSTFENGSLCLGGRLGDLTLFFNSNNGIGSFEAGATFDAGSCVVALEGTQAQGFTFGGVLDARAGGPLPSGYDLHVDGVLEAEGIDAVCPLECLALRSAHLVFPHDVADGFEWSNGSTHIRGAFAPCALAGAPDPENDEISVRIGAFRQVFAPGTLQRVRRGPAPAWEFRENQARGEITLLHLQRVDADEWTFEIRARGMARGLLLPNEPELDLQLTLGLADGSVGATLREHRRNFTLHGPREPCDDDGDTGGDTGGVARGRADKAAPVARSGIELLPVTPNPFNARASVVLRVHRSGHARVSVFDPLGHRVRVLHDADLGAGDHHLLWDGTDTRGIERGSGMYVFRLESADGITTRKAMLLK